MAASSTAAGSGESSDVDEFGRRRRRRTMRRGEWIRTAARSLQTRGDGEGKQEVARGLVGGHGMVATQLPACWLGKTTRRRRWAGPAGEVGLAPGGR